MSGFENAARVFHACESSEGWEACREFVVPGAPLIAQAEPLADVPTVQAYAEWMAGVSAWMPDGHYEVHAASWDEEKHAATFFATYRGHHSGEGGPLPPTNEMMESHYVFVYFTNREGLVEKAYKIWNAGWAMRQLGWA